MAIKSRERWFNRTAFLMAALGSAIGLGNLWRFPYVAFKNGGGAFFIPYFIALFSAGVPLMIIEYALGQKYQGGAPKALAAVTSKFRWVGWLALMVGMTITTYYIVVMAYSCHYAIASFNVAWELPAPSIEVTKKDGLPVARPVPTESVRVYVPAQDAEQKRREEEAQSNRRPQQRLPVYTDAEANALRLAEDAKPEPERLTYVPFGQNVGNYFSQVCLGRFRPAYWTAARAAEHEPAQAQVSRAGRREITPSQPPVRTGYVRDMFKLSPHLVFWSFVVWLAIFLIIYKGVHSVGKVVMITVPLPFLLLMIVLLRGLTLPGATEGLVYYLKPDWEMLKDAKVWLAAYGQVFFSLSLGFGILTAYASYMPEDSDVTNSAFITSLGDTSFSFLAGLGVFTVLGYLAYISNVPIKDVAAAGPGLVFVTYPIALSKMPMGIMGVAFISFVFFACLLTLGIDSAFSLVEGVVTGFMDRFPKVSRKKMTAFFCSLGFAGSLLFCTASGLMWLDIVDNWMSNYGLIFVGLLECIAIGYFFHIEELKDYVNRHSELQVHNWFDAFVRVITPAVLIFLLATQFLTDITAPYGGYDKILAQSVNIAGWGWFALMIVLSLLLSQHYLAVGAVGAVVALFGAFLAYMGWRSGAPLSALVAPALLAAIAVVVIFGGLAACIALAMKERRVTGLSLREVERDDTPRL